VVTKATTRRLFFAGTALFTLVFILLTLHTHSTIAKRTNSDRLDERVVSGMHVWQRYNCENCHTLLGEGAYYAPDLTEIVAQRGKGYLTAFLANPAAFYSEERDGRLMPTLGLSPAEIDDVLEFLTWVDGIDSNGWPPRPILVSGAAPRGLPGIETQVDAAQPSDRGKALFNGAGACAGCHAVAPGVRLVGPSLAGVGAVSAQRVTDPAYHGDATDAEGYLQESIVDPSRYVVPAEPSIHFATPDGRSFMPDQFSKTLDAGQVDDLVAYLITLR
jgi:nitric oxide reductase subunit C